MPKQLLRRYLPSPSALRRHKALAPLGDWLNRSEIWHLHRRSVSGAVFVGLFCAFLPVPFQMIIAGALAIAARVNLPISVALVWISNPLTMGPLFYFCYRLGAWLLDMREGISGITLEWDWLLQNWSEIAYPLIFGALLCGWIAGVTGFVIVRVSWRLHVIRRWQARRERRRLAKAAKRLAAQLKTRDVDAP
ncbi:MAG: DUF2062 domain-containing protein [Pseudomonadales bacterium]